MSEAKMPADDQWLFAVVEGLAAEHSVADSEVYAVLTQYLVQPEFTKGGRRWYFRLEFKEALTRSRERRAARIASKGPPRRRKK